MIKNDKQNSITKQKLKEFQSALTELQSQEGLHPILKKAQIDGVKSQIEDFERDILEYEQLKKGEINFLVADSLPNFQLALIKTRIIKGWTQADLASKVDMQEQQIQRYEACNYSTATIARLSLIAEALEMDIQPIKIEFHKPYHFSEEIDENRLSIIKKRVRERNNKLFELND
ncbi:MAG: helix-turn-helix transcriptional regulator [Chitinophagaceae bacterium]|nr:helix-turn-helix transcriptional regulator [Chitinophagaceae bacterium]MBP9097562.1 helix-turn-helix transcriptional regulator [Ferruginibacter sp.]